VTLSRAAAALLAALLAAASAAEPLDADALVRRAEEVMRGTTSEILAAMTIERPRWTRTVRFRSWDDRARDRSFTRILDPAKDRGTGFLKVESTLWTYLPSVERTTRLPPSMLLQPWMGSDFTNDDLVRESSLIDDYRARLLGEREIDGRAAVGVELLPKEEAPVVWAKMELWLERERLAPLAASYYDEPEPGRYAEVRRMRYSDLRDVQGRPVPHRWEMLSLDKPGHVTRVDLEEIRFDQPMSDELFTQAHLQRAEAVR
jgi:outer membrane lipoprotein-sorting protein